MSDRDNNGKRDPSHCGEVESESGRGQACETKDGRRHSAIEFNPSLRFTSWRDIDLESRGYDPRSTYVEKFWLPFLGPSTVVLMRRITELLEENPHGFSVELSDLSQMIGLGTNISKHSSLQKTLNRLLIFELARVMPSSALSMRIKLPPLPTRYFSRLPETLQREHTDDFESQSAGDMEGIRARARSLAISLANLGHDRPSIEKQLLSWRFHPSVCYETLNWIESPKTNSNELTD